MTDKPTEISALILQLKSIDAGERCAAASRLGRLYAEMSPVDPPLARVACLIGEANDVTADVAAPFIRQFTNSPFIESWEAQTGTSISDWLSDMLCRQPDVKDEFSACGLADTARNYLNGSPSIVRRILTSGKTWRAFIVASGAREPSEEGRQLFEEMATLEDLAVASRATFNLAASYQILHPRAHNQGWVVQQTLDNFHLYWCRFPQKSVPHRVWSWRRDSLSFAKTEATSVIKRIIHPSRLGEPVRARRYPRWQFFDYEEVSVGFDKPGECELPADHSTYAISFRRFQLRPRERTWANLPAIQSLVAETLSREMRPEGT